MSTTRAKRHQKHQKLVHGSADYYEALFRARYVRALRQLQKDTSIGKLAGSLNRSSLKRPKLDEAALMKAMEPVKQALIAAFMRGGKLGAAHVKATLNG
jgi:hypothetical protein